MLYDKLYQDTGGTPFPKIAGVVLCRVGLLFFYPKWGLGLRPSAALLYLIIAQVHGPLNKMKTLQLSEDPALSIMLHVPLLLFLFA